MGKNRTTHNWKNVHLRFCRWRDKLIWEKILEAVIIEPELEWIMIDASHVKTHQHVAGAVGGNQDIGLTKKGGAKYQDTSGRGCEWCAGQNFYYFGYHP